MNAFSYLQVRQRWLQKRVINYLLLVRIARYTDQNAQPYMGEQSASSFRRYLCLWLLLFFCRPVLSTNGQFEIIDSRKVEAAFLRNFARYVTWPSNTFNDDSSPWHVCVLGSDPFGDTLDDAFAGRREQGRPFQVFRLSDLNEARKCQIVYVSYQVSMRRRAVLAELKEQPVLTVSNAPGFLQEGGMIRFEVGKHVEININLDKVRAASLSMQTKVLEVSSSFIVNGRLHQAR